jgi:hypothetical protein
MYGHILESVSEEGSISWQNIHEHQPTSGQVLRPNQSRTPEILQPGKRSEAKVYIEEACLTQRLESPPLCVRGTRPDVGSKECIGHTCIHSDRMVTPKVAESRS